MGQRVLVKLAAAAAVTASLLLTATGAATASPVAPDAAATDANRGGDRGVTPNAKLPEAIRVTESEKLKLVATQRGTGKQVYDCINGVATFREPIATLTTLRGAPAGIHGGGPFWASFDGSRVNGSSPISAPPPDGDANNIPWLKVKGTPVGLSGVFSKVTVIQRTDTRGGVAPKSCTPGTTVAVDYSTIYQFWAPR